MEYSTRCCWRRGSRGAVEACGAINANSRGVACGGAESTRCRGCVTGDERIEVVKTFWADLTGAAPNHSEFDDSWWRHIQQRFDEVESNIAVDDHHALSAALTKEEVRKALKALDVRKSGGCDGVQAFMLKWGGPRLISTLTAMFNRVWLQTAVPQSWKDAWVVPIYKKDGAEADPANYRPISLLSLVGRLLSFVINARLYDMLEARDLLHEPQFGFRRGRGCPEAVLTLREAIELRRKRGERTWLAFIDVAKAYDSTWRQGMFVKLFDLVGKSKLWAVLVEWYTNDRSCIFTRSRASTWWKNTTGVKQGDICAPVLYSVFISDVVEALQARHLGVAIDDGAFLAALLYADDQVLLAPSEASLQQALNVVTEFAHKWRFKLNAKKSAVMVYGRPKRKQPLAWPVAWVLGGQLVNECFSYKYLGVHMQADGGFGIHVAALTSAAKRRLGFIKHHTMRMDLPSKYGRILAMVALRPLMEYGCTTWVCQSPVAEVEQLDAVWLAACKAISGVPAYTTPEVVLGDLLLQPQRIRRARQVVHFYHKVVLFEPSSIVARVYRARRQQFMSLVHDPTAVGNFWISRVQESLNLLGMGDFLMDEARMEALSTLEWKDLVRFGAARATRAWWWGRVHSAPELGILRRLCPNGPRWSPHHASTTGRVRTFVTQLRAGSLPLQVCKAACQYDRPGGALRICQLCWLDDETLEHFIFVCPKFRIFRERNRRAFAAIAASEIGIADVLTGSVGTRGETTALLSCWAQMWQCRRDLLSPRRDPALAQLRWCEYLD